MTKTDLAQAYFAGIRRRDVEHMVSLFADDGTMILPDGRELKGAEALRGMYTQLFAANAPTPTPRHIVAGPNGVAVEIEAILGDGSSRKTANFFSFDQDGRIERVSIYRQG